MAVIDRETSIVADFQSPQDIRWEYHKGVYGLANCYVGVLHFPMGNDIKKILRLDLYKRVWETPVTQLAEEYGLRYFLEITARLKPVI